MNIGPKLSKRREEGKKRNHTREMEFYRYCKYWHWSVYTYSFFFSKYFIFKICATVCQFQSMFMFWLFYVCVCMCVRAKRSLVIFASNVSRLWLTLQMYTHKHTDNNNSSSTFVSIACSRLVKMYINFFHLFLISVLLDGNEHKLRVQKKKKHVQQIYMH